MEISIGTAMGIQSKSFVGVDLGHSQGGTPLVEGMAV